VADDIAWGAVFKVANTTWLSTRKVSSTGSFERFPFDVLVPIDLRVTRKKLFPSHGAWTYRFDIEITSPPEDSPIRSTPVYKNIRIGEAVTKQSITAG
jgi:hypothetical protein